jgi:ADP-ribose pyrophosphatase
VNEPSHPVREESETLLRGRIFDVVASRLEFPSGLRQELWIVEHPGAVAIAPVNAAGELVLVRQYRHSARDAILELPAGRIEAGEPALAAARRELSEETGLSARKWRPLARFLAAPGFSSEWITLFEARDLTPGPSSPDEDEELEVVTRPLEAVVREAQDAKTLLAAWMLLAQASKREP